MASKKHHKQDSTRPTKARARRMRGSVAQDDTDADADRGPDLTGLAAPSEG